MLIDFDHGGRVVTTVPFQKDFKFWLGRLTPQEQAAIRAHIDAMLAAGDIHTTSWMPGADWWNTPLWPIYFSAARQSVRQAALCFGLFVCERILHRCATFNERWGFKHCEKDGYPIKGRTYFQL